MGRSIVIAAAFMLVGIGCADLDLNRRVTETNPLGEPGRGGFALTEGLEMESRPTFLGSGAVKDVLGEDAGRRTVRVAVREESDLELVWDVDETEGRIRARRTASAKAMLLPALWPEGEADAGENGLLWLSAGAYRELQEDGRTEWSLGLAEDSLGGVADAMERFRDIARRLFGESGETELETPFTVRRAGASVFPLRIDGSVEGVDVILAEGWFARYVILDDPENPLVLKVDVKPVAMEALDAFTDIGIDIRAIGYEITAVRRP